MMRSNVAWSLRFRRTGLRGGITSRTRRSSEIHQFNEHVWLGIHLTWVLERTRSAVPSNSNRLVAHPSDPHRPCVMHCVLLCIASPDQNTRPSNLKLSDLARPSLRVVVPLQRSGTRIHLVNARRKPNTQNQKTRPTRLSSHEVFADAVRTPVRHEEVVQHTAVPRL